MMNAHKLAKYFPILEGEEFDLLVDDIRKNGQLEPIVTYHGEILDGINRARVCEILGIEPLAEEYTGDDPLSYVVSINVRRRHMDTSQRAMLATEMLPEFEAEAKKRQQTGKHRSSQNCDNLVLDHQGWARSSSQAAKVFNVSPRSIQQAKQIKKDAPNRVQDIVSGKISVNAIGEELRRAASIERFQKKEEKENKKLPVEYPKAVKDYFTACSMFKESLELAIRCAGQGMFAPEALGIMQTKHDTIRGLMDQLEGGVK